MKSKSGASFSHSDFIKGIECYWNAFSDSPLPVAVVHKNGQAVKLNPAMQRLTGIAVSDADGSLDPASLIRTLLPDGQDADEAFVLAGKAARNEAKIVSIPVTITCRNGIKQCVDLYAYSPESEGDISDFFIVFAIKSTESKCIENQLKDIEGRYSALFYRSRDIILIHDFDGTFIDANPAALRLLGYKRKELPSLSIYSVIERNQEQRYRQVIDDIRRIGYQQERAEYTYRKKNGEMVYISTNGLLLNRNGIPYSVMVMGHDITDQKNNDDTRRNYISNLDFLTSSAMEIMQLSSKEEIFIKIAVLLKKIIGDGVVSVSDYNATSGILETKAIAGIDSSIESIIRLWGRHPVGMTYKVDSENKRQMLKGKLVRIGGLYELTFSQIPRPVCKTLESIFGIREIIGIGFANKGDLYGVAIFIIFNTTKPLDNGLIETFCAQVSIALKRCRADTSLSHHEKNKLELTDHIKDIIYTIDLNGVVTYIGPQILRYGYSTDDIIGHHMMDFIHNDDKPRILSNVERAFKNGEEVQSEFKLRGKSGGIHWVEDNSTLIRDTNGCITGLTGILRDITRRINIEEALRISESMLREQKEILERKNLALRELIDHIEIEKNSIKDDIIVNVNEILMPILDRLKLHKNPEQYIDLLKHLLGTMTSSFGRRMTVTQMQLTPREMEICSMVASGLRTKEISGLLNISVLTIENHRKNIRRKLKIRNRKINLSSHLKQMM